jgi:hypothetical protein
MRCFAILCCVMLCDDAMQSVPKQGSIDECPILNRLCYMFDWNVFLLILICVHRSQNAEDRPTFVEVMDSLLDIDDHLAESKYADVSLYMVDTNCSWCAHVILIGSIYLSASIERLG